MREHFPGYFPPSEQQIKDLWDKCVFVFDANILLNFYRYSDKTRDEFLRALKSMEERIWLPHRAAEEFFTNRLRVISQQEKAYDDTIRTIDELRNDLENARQHPFVSESTMERVQQVFGVLKNELLENQKLHTTRITDDSIQSSVADVFAGRVGEAYEAKRLDEIFADGKVRYSESVPPGFKDQGKADDAGSLAEKCRRYGDLLVWYQILDYAKSTGVSVILVTDDKKEDWWQTFKGRTLGPRPELVQEFLLKTKHSFHMYQADRFLEFANQYLDRGINEAVLSEIREVRLDVEAQQTALERHYHEMARRLEYDALCSKSEVLEERLSTLTQQREELALHRRLIIESLPDDATVSQRAEMVRSIFPTRTDVDAQVAAVEAELAALEWSRRHLMMEMHDVRNRRRPIEQEPGAYADKPRRSG